MNGRVVTILMSLSLMQDEADDLVGGHVDMDAVFGVGKADPDGDVDRLLMFGPRSFHLLESPECEE